MATFPQRKPGGKATPEISSPLVYADARGACRQRAVQWTAATRRLS
jgi:hypothetical protein